MFIIIWVSHWKYWNLKVSKPGLAALHQEHHQRKLQHTHSLWGSSVGRAQNWGTFWDPDNPTVHYLTINFWWLTWLILDSHYSHLTIHSHTLKICKTMSDLVKNVLQKSRFLNFVWKYFGSINILKHPCSHTPQPSTILLPEFAPLHGMKRHNPQLRCRTPAQSLRPFATLAFRCYAIGIRKLSYSWDRSMWSKQLPRVFKHNRLKLYRKLPIAAPFLTTIAAKSGLGLSFLWNVCLRQS